MSCVYFIRHYGTTPVKVGASKHDNPASRVQDFEVGSPFGIELLGFIKSKDAFSLEKRIHAQLQSKNIKGEWYDLSIEEVNNIIDSYTGNLELAKLGDFLSFHGILPSEAIKLLRKFHTRMPSKSKTSLSYKESLLNIYGHSSKESENGWISKSDFVKECMIRLDKSRAQIYRVMGNDLFMTKKKGKRAFIKIRS